MKPLFIKEMVDSYIRENFLRIENAVKEIDTNFENFTAPIYTTSTRGAIVPKKGMIIFNETTGKFQGYTGVAWSDLN